MSQIKFHKGKQEEIDELITKGNIIPTNVYISTDNEAGLYFSTDNGAPAVLTNSITDLEKRIEKLEEGFTKIDLKTQDNLIYDLIGRVKEINGEPVVKFNTSPITFTAEDCYIDGDFFCKMEPKLGSFLID